MSPSLRGSGHHYKGNLVPRVLPTPAKNVYACFAKNATWSISGNVIGSEAKMPAKCCWDERSDGSFFWQWQLCNFLPLQEIKNYFGRRFDGDVFSREYSVLELAKNHSGVVVRQRFFHRMEQQYLVSGRIITLLISCLSLVSLFAAQCTLTALGRNHFSSAYSACAVLRRSIWSRVQTVAPEREQHAMRPAGKEVSLTVCGRFPGKRNRNSL